MPVKSAVKKVITLLAALVVCWLISSVIAYHTASGVQGWYAGLVKPVFSLPLSAFSPIWTFSFLFMGLSLYLILQAGLKKHEVLPGFILFVLQLLLIIVWSYAFFNLHSLFLAFMCIIALWAALLCAIIQIFRFSVGSGMPLIPYFFLVCYLTYLNYGIMVLNNATFTL